MTYQEIIDRAETLGWSVHEETEEKTQHHFFEFQQESPAGEDFSFYIEAKSPDELIHLIFEYAEDFDSEEHAEMWIQAKKSGVSGVPSIKTLVEDADAIQEMLDKLADAMFGNQICSDPPSEDSCAAEVRWDVNDICDAAAEQGVPLTKDQAAQWWKANQSEFQECLVEFGNNLLSDIDWNLVVCSSCGRMIQTDETARVINEGTEQERVVCSDCHNAMWEDNEISQCAHCGRWYDVSLLKSDPEPVGGDTFTPCPGCGHDLVDGLTREERLAEAQPAEENSAPQYAVTFFYGAGIESATYLFGDECAAKQFLRDNYNLKVQFDTEENHCDVTHEISEDGWSAKIINHFPSYDETTTMFISRIYA